MIQLKQIKVLLCNFLRRVLRASAINCEFFSIWECSPSPPKPSYPQMVVQYVKNKVSCSEELFPFMFYFLLMISLFGVVSSSAKGTDSPLTLPLLPDPQLHRVLAGASREERGALAQNVAPEALCLLQRGAAASLPHPGTPFDAAGLAAAALRRGSGEITSRTSVHPGPLIRPPPQVKPQLFAPWLTISSISMAIDGFFVVAEAIYQRRMITLRTFLLLVCPVLNMHCAACVKKKFVGAYAASGEPSLTWW